MNFSSYKLCSQLLRYSSAKSFTIISKNHLLRKPSSVQAHFCTRVIITRPKELDLLRQKAKEHEQGKDNGSKKSGNVEIDAFGYFLISIPIITFGLGVWQIWRRQWKLNLMADMQNQLSREPIDLPEDLNDLAKLEYCPIKVRGEFLYDNEFTIGPRSLIVDGQGATEGKGNLISSGGLNKGYHIITPFKLEDRDLVILVNRGWVPNKFKSAEERKALQRKGIVEITGINRLNETRPQFLPKNRPEQSMWQHRDIYQMAEFANTSPIFLDRIETDSGKGIPIGSQTKLNLRNEHLSYIVTWFGLSALTGFYCYRMFILKMPLF